MVILLMMSEDTKEILIDQAAEKTCSERQDV